MSPLSPIAIPESIAALILPNDTLSVAELLNFRLPIPRSTSFTDSDDYLTEETHNTEDLEEIRNLPSPPAAVVHALILALQETSAAAVTSSHCPRTAGKRYPLWVITYWGEVLQIRVVLERWISADNGIRTQMERLDHDEPEAGKELWTACDAMLTLPWSGSISGFSAKIALHHLAAYFTEEWLSDEHENQMLDILRDDLRDRDHPLANSAHIETTNFIPILSDGFKNQEEYATGQHFRWLRDLGQSFATGVKETLGLIVNKDGNHWVTVVIDFVEETIWYGDSLATRMGKEVENVIDWWIFLHVGEYFQKKFLPITRQKDGYSCGLLAWNALRAYYLDEDLMKAGSVADGRLGVVGRILDRHNETVCINFTMREYQLIVTL